MKANIGYEANIQQLEGQISARMNPERTTEEKLLSVVQLGQIQAHFSNMAPEKMLSVYGAAVNENETLVIEAFETAPSFLIDDLLIPSIAAAQEARWGAIDPKISAQIAELRTCQAVTHGLLDDAISVVGAKTDVIADLASGEISFGTEGGSEND